MVVTNSYIVVPFIGAQVQNHDFFFPIINSYNPQGDPDKEKMPASDYVHNFKAIDVEANRTERAAALQYGT